jgi:hypothetical protein
VKIYLSGYLVGFKLSESDSVVVITSVSHTEGREFEPRSDYFFFSKLKNQLILKNLELPCLIIKQN